MNKYYTKHNQKIQLYGTTKVKRHTSRAPDFPLLSVCVTAYNHEQYISKCLDSILMQKTNFEIEILLGEDNSSDETRKICIEYADKYPDKIRLFLHDRSNNISIDNHPTGRYNFIHNLMNARGKYIALCDGDDYWTNADKLQKQVDFLEKNLNCSICFHPVCSITNDGNSQTNFPPFNKTIYTLNNLIMGNFIYTSTVMFKNNLFEELPEWFFEVGFADWPLHLINSQFGKIGFLKNEIMSVYRIHDGGIWSLLSKKYTAKKTIEILEHLQGGLTGYNEIKRKLSIIIHKVHLIENNKLRKLIQIPVNVLQAFCYFF